MSSDVPSSRQKRHELAAIDLGSNSFHMVLGRLVDGQIVIADRLKEMVQLGAGLDDERRLGDEARARAIACLERFGQRIRGLSSEQVRVVGTNTLRVARDIEPFLAQAERVLGHPIEIINGIEEARLIYAGVVRDRPPSEERLLVIDIGGGSTELVIGKGSTPLELESLYVGSIGLMQRNFQDGMLNAQRFRSAEVMVLQELERVQPRFRRLGWQRAIGASGTARAVARIIAESEPGAQGITRETLRRLRQAVIAAGSVRELSFKGLSPARATVLPGGLAVLSAIFESFELDALAVSDSALREGLLGDLLGRFRRHDVRGATVDALMDRYHVDKEQAYRVEATLRALLPQAAAAWELPLPRCEELGAWAARLHEIGLDIAHSHYHKHGAYVLEHADMPGFSRQEQRLLSALVRAHRRRFPRALLESASSNARLEPLAILLRLAILLHRGRGEVCAVQLSPGRRSLELAFEPGWLEAHPLTLADLQEEARFLQAAEFELELKDGTLAGRARQGSAFSPK